MIKKIINKWFCGHKWKKLQEQLITKKYSNGKTVESIVTYYTCTECGKILKIQE